MRFRLEHVRSKKGPAGARFSKFPVTERPPEAVLFSVFKYILAVWELRNTETSFPMTTSELF